MPEFEYTFGVVVSADDEDAAWELVREVSERLDALDVEGDSQVEGPTRVMKIALPRPKGADH